METGDGWLVRLHPPGGALTPAQLGRIAALADEHGNGLIEISARANLQIRGVSEATHPALVAALLRQGLVDEHDGDGPQRLTLISPLLPPPPACGGEGRGGGESPGRRLFRSSRQALHAPPSLTLPHRKRVEGGGARPLIDASALAGAIEAQGRAIPGLPAKTLVVVDDGGSLPLDGVAADLRIVAVAAGQVALGLPSGLWLGPVEAAHAVEAVCMILRRFAGHHLGAPDRVCRLRDLSPEMQAALSDFPPTQPPAARRAPRRAGLFEVGNSHAALVGLPFGRCDASVLTRLAEAGELDGAADIRLVPWRGLACLGPTRAGAKSWLDTAQALGLIVADDDPRLSVQACAGKPACRSGETAAMADAATLAGAIAPLLAAGTRLHVSGCIKSCAHAGPTDLTLVGEQGRYRVVVGGGARDPALATLDVAELIARLQPGQDIHSRLIARRQASGRRV
jgi:sulfite reductase beta subunit-like hemoprotein